MNIPFSGFEITFNDDPTLDGIGLTLYCVGCPFNCKGCQNPSLQDPENGIETTLEEIKEIINERKELIDSVIFCGGDFYAMYKIQLRDLVEYVHSLGKKAILYTGEKYENLQQWYKLNLDVVVDGRFEADNKNTETSFPASNNQRIFIRGVETDRGSLPINID